MSRCPGPHLLSCGLCGGTDAGLRARAEAAERERERDEARLELDRVRAQRDRMEDRAVRAERSLRKLQGQRDQMATTLVHQMEGWSGDEIRTAIAFERVTSADLRAHNLQLSTNLHGARAEVERLRGALVQVHGLIEEGIGDTDPGDPDDPLLRAAQLIAQIVPPPWDHYAALAGKAPSAGDNPCLVCGEQIPLGHIQLLYKDGRGAHVSCERKIGGILADPTPAKAREP